MSRQIPGYYYDEEKKKYFKIQPNHAVPTGSAYSVDQVKRRRVEFETASEIARNVHRRENLVRRARILQDPLLGGSLSREHGYGPLLDGSITACVDGWDSQEIFPSEASPSHDPHVRAVSRLLSNQDLYAPAIPDDYVQFNKSTVAMGAFDFDPVTHGLFYPFGGQTLCGVVERKHHFSVDEPYKPILLRRGHIQLATNHSPINSITIDPKTRVMLTTWQAPSMGHNIHIVKFDRGEVNSDPFSRGDLFFHDILGASMIIRVSWGANIAPTIWSATHGAQGSPFVFVVACDDGVMTIDETASLHAMMSSPIQPSGQRSAVLAVECLAQHPSVILAGARNGNIISFDVRQRERQFQSNVESIKHPSAVSKIKQLNDHVIVVAGLNSTLCNYDLRFVQQRPREKAWPDWHCSYTKGPESAGDEVSNPILLYPEHRNSAHVEHGFDVDVEAGILAAAQDDPYRTISIFSLKSGQMLRSLHVKDTQTLSSCDMADVKALKFVQERGSGYMKSLWVAKGTRIIRFAW